MAASDVMAIGAIRALHDAGLRVPEDVSVTGFDGLPVSSYQVPSLSTVEQSVRAMARRAVEILLLCVEQEGGAVHEAVPFHLLPRESIRRIDRE